MIQLTKIYHQIIAEKKDINVAVDMTCGHGFDTLLLAQHAKKVFAFDIQEAAIEETQYRLSEFQNVTLIHDSHENIKNYVHDKIDVAVFNLGYMPGGNLSIYTSAKTTLVALKNLFDCLATKGLIVIEAYPHNPEEVKTVMNYVSSLKPQHDVIYSQLLNKPNAPSLFIIRKN